MHPIQGWNIQSVQKPRRGNIGAEHALFNQLVCIVANHGHYSLNLSTLIKYNARFNGVELDGSASVPGSSQALV